MENMNYVNRLKHRNLLEIIGFATKNHPKKVLSGGVLLIFMLVAIFSTPHFIYMYKKNEAKNYIESAKSIITTIESKQHEAKSKLTTYPTMYKDYEKYMTAIVEESKTLSTFQDAIQSYETKYNNKDIEGILSDFDSKKSNNTLIHLAKKNSEEFEQTYIDINDVYQLNNELEKGYVTLANFSKQSDPSYVQMKTQNDEVQRNGITTRVKQKSQHLLVQVKSKNDKFAADLEQIFVYTKAEEGKFNILELKALQTKQNKVINTMKDALTAYDSFDAYWDELHEQYFTIVTDNYATRSSDYISELNPLYKEWTEQEKYQDTETKYKSETYTERVYKGSRIVGDTKEDIYENVTKTKQVPYQVQVTKTRDVKKDNGQPRMVPVAYDLYQYYYKLEKHTPSGTETSEEYVGKKHAKFDYSIHSWNYEDHEKEGYVVWKQIWNDVEGIVKGENIRPKLKL